MFRKCIVIILILLAPLQAWAVVDMSFKHTSLTTTLDDRASSHSCHQDVSSLPIDITENHSQTYETECSSCVLCMSFAHFVYQIPHSISFYLSTFNGEKTSFISHYIASPSKPPIL